MSQSHKAILHITAVCSQIHCTHKNGGGCSRVVPYTIASSAMFLTPLSP